MQCMCVCGVHVCMYACSVSRPTEVHHGPDGGPLPKFSYCICQISDIKALQDILYCNKTKGSDMAVDHTTDLECT